MIYVDNRTYGKIALEVLKNDGRIVLESRGCSPIEISIHKEVADKMLGDIFDDAVVLEKIKESVISELGLTKEQLESDPYAAQLKLYEYLLNNGGE